MTQPQYESVTEAAQRLGVTPRAVQKWAAQGRIPGAIKLGKLWKIPKNTDIFDGGELSEPEPTSPYQTNVEFSGYHMPLLLLNSEYEVGSCMRYINSINDPNYRSIALGEYYFYSGNAKKSIEVFSPYLQSNNPIIRYSSNLMSMFANLSLGRLDQTRVCLVNLHEQLSVCLKDGTPNHIRAIAVFTATAASVLFHTDMPAGAPQLESYLKYLTGGTKVFSCYILAHKAYLENDYVRCLAIADSCLMLFEKTYPIPFIYTHLVAAMALVNLKRVDEAKSHLIEAWSLAEADGLIEPFSQHYGLLGGMIEVFFRRDYPNVYKHITHYNYSFSSSWRNIYEDENRELLHYLTSIEYTIAMLYSKGWSYKEIASHLDISQRSVSARIADIYVKLDVNNRVALAQILLS